MLRSIPLACALICLGCGEPPPPEMMTPAPTPETPAPDAPYQPQPGPDPVFAPPQLAQLSPSPVFRLVGVTTDGLAVGVDMQGAVTGYPIDGAPAIAIGQGPGAEVAHHLVLVSNAGDLSAYTRKMGKLTQLSKFQSSYAGSQHGRVVIEEPVGDGTQQIVLIDADGTHRKVIKSKVYATDGWTSPRSHGGNFLVTWLPAPGPSATGVVATVDSTDKLFEHGSDYWTFNYETTGTRIILFHDQGPTTVTSWTGGPVYTLGDKPSAANSADLKSVFTVDKQGALERFELASGTWTPMLPSGVRTVIDESIHGKQVLIWDSEGWLAVLPSTGGTPHRLIKSPSGPCCGDVFTGDDRVLWRDNKVLHALAPDGTETTFGDRVDWLSAATGSKVVVSQYDTVKKVSQLDVVDMATGTSRMITAEATSSFYFTAGKTGIVYTTAAGLFVSPL